MDGGPQQPALKLQTVKTQIALESRPGDKSVDSDLLAQFDLFRRMKKSISAEKLPGGIVLRRYNKGDIVFQQGQAGGTAFYIPTADDLSRLKAFDAELQLSSIPFDAPDRNRQILTAVIVPSTSRTRAKGFFERLFSPAAKTPSRQISSIPSDGPTDINYETREAPLMEGDVFGEMSCISFTPRSATVIARVDCLLLEFNRNVFETLRDDPNHQSAMDKEYRRRTLETHLRQFQIFSGLTESQIQTLKGNVTLEIVPPGKVICEEGEPWSDSKPLDVFIVRNGVVQVIANTNLSLQMDDIRDWTTFCRQLNDSQPEVPKVVAKPVASPVASAAGNASKVDAKPRSIPERVATTQVITEKASAAVAAPVPAEVSSAPKKLSPIELMRAKQAAAAAAKEQDSAAPVGDQPATAHAEEKPIDEVAAPKKLSPIEQMRAKQAAAAAAKSQDSAAPVGDQPATSPAEEKPVDEAAALKKLSPIEQMRAKQAAASAAKAQEAAAPVGAQPTTSPSEEKPVGDAAAPKKLSPIEQMRAKQAAAAAATKTTAVSITAEDQLATSPADGNPGAVVAVPKKLSPIEQMRAKQAAVAGADPDLSKSPSPPSTGEHPVPPKAIPGLSTENLEKPQIGAGKAGAEVDSSLPLLQAKRSEQPGPLIFLVKSWLNELPIRL